MGLSTTCIATTSSESLSSVASLPASRPCSDVGSTCVSPPSGGLLSNGNLLSSCGSSRSAVRTSSSCSSANSSDTSLPSRSLLTMADILGNPSQLPVTVDVEELADVKDMNVVNQSLVNPGTRLTLLYPKVERAVHLKNKDGVAFTELASFDNCSFGVLPKDGFFDDKLYLCPRHVLRAEKRPRIVRCLKEMHYSVGDKKYDIPRSRLFTVSTRQEIINEVEYVVWTSPKAGRGSGVPHASGDISCPDEEEVLLPLHIQGFFTALLNPKLYQLSDLLDESLVGGLHMPIRVQAVSPRTHKAMDKYTVLTADEQTTVIAVTQHGEALRITTDVPLVFRRLKGAVQPPPNDEGHAHLSMSLRVLSGIQFLQSAFTTVTTARKGTISGCFPHPPPMSDNSSDDSSAGEEDVAEGRADTVEGVPAVPPPPPNGRNGRRVSNHGPLKRRPPVSPARQRLHIRSKSEESDVTFEKDTASSRHQQVVDTPPSLPPPQSPPPSPPAAPEGYEENQGPRDSPLQLPHVRITRQPPQIEPNHLQLLRERSSVTSSDAALSDDTLSALATSPSASPISIHTRPLPQPPNRMAALNSCKPGRSRRTGTSKHHEYTHLLSARRGGPPSPRRASLDSMSPSSASLNRRLDPLVTLGRTPSLHEPGAPDPWHDDFTVTFESSQQPFSLLMQQSSRRKTSDNEMYLIRQHEQLQRFCSRLQIEQKEMIMRFEMIRSLVDNILYVPMDAQRK